MPLVVVAAPAAQQPHKLMLTSSPAYRRSASQAMLFESTDLSCRLNQSEQALVEPPTTPQKLTLSSFETTTTPNSAIDGIDEEYRRSPVQQRLRPVKRPSSPKSPRVVGNSQDEWDQLLVEGHVDPSFLRMKFQIESLMNEATSVLESNSWKDVIRVRTPLHHAPTATNRSDTASPTPASPSLLLEDIEDIDDKRRSWNDMPHPRTLYQWFKYFRSTTNNTDSAGLDGLASLTLEDSSTIIERDQSTTMPSLCVLSRPHELAKNNTAATSSGSQEISIPRFRPDKIHTRVLKR